MNSAVDALLVLTQRSQRLGFLDSVVFFGNGVDQCLRCHDFLSIILARYLASQALAEELKAQLHEAARKVAWDELDRLSEPYGAAILRLHLDIESFYVFAKLLLDRLADLFGLFCGVKWTAKGSSHAELNRRFAKIVPQQNLVVDPPELKDLMEQAYQRVITYRNEFVEHLGDPKVIHGVKLGEGGAKLAPVVNAPGPNDKDVKLSESPSELMTFIDRYVGGLTTFFQRNLERSTLPKGTQLG